MEDERDELLMQKHALQLRLDKPIMPMVSLPCTSPQISLQLPQLHCHALHWLCLGEIAYRHTLYDVQMHVIQQSVGT